jgi:CheY-like chemotaxis protein
MPPEVIERAFEPFFTTKPVGKGTGLGLSQFHGFAAQTGGRAEIESEPGKGTTLRLLLPRTEKPVASRTCGESEAAVPQGLRVLLVEDNEQVLEFAQHLLAHLGCSVLAAASGEEALATLDREPVDFVFTDVVMPGLSGVELAKTIRQAHPSLPVILTSGYSDEVVRGSAGAFEVVRKPYRRETLAAAIARAVGAATPLGARAEA